MSSSLTEKRLTPLLEKLERAIASEQLSPEAGKNIRRWLTETRYQDDAEAVAEHIEQGQWQILDDVFWTVIPFGTGGRRGRMYPIGCNAINRRTIGESAQGLASYINRIDPSDRRACAIAYDTRHRSRQFAQWCASIMVANGFKVFFLDDFRSTPELSFLVRLRSCQCGIMVTASHNPPSDNAVKIYWNNGGQLVPPHDENVIQSVDRVDEIKHVEFQAAVARGEIELCLEQVDRELVQAHLAESFSGSRQISILYSPLHGVGEPSVVNALKSAGFDDVEVFEPHREKSGDFPNVPGNVSNPENPHVFDQMIERARRSGAGICLATDPDADRMGAAAPLTTDPGGSWATFTGNQLSVLLGDYVLEQRNRIGTLPDKSYIVTTLVTTAMLRRVAESYGVQVYDQLLVGFKWICDTIDRVGPDHFVYGTEESHGFLVGKYCRDKDGIVACLLMTELAASLHKDGLSLHEKLDALYWQHGYHAEHVLNLRMEGSDGMRRMERLMNKFRTNPPTELGGLAVTRIRDYLEGPNTQVGRSAETIDSPHGNLIVMELDEDGNHVAVRPSGTEPKIKFYFFTYVPAELLSDLDLAKSEMAVRLKDLEQSIQVIADQVSADH